MMAGGGAAGSGLLERHWRQTGRALALAALVLVAACGRIIPEAQPPGVMPAPPPLVLPTPAPPPNAIALGVSAGPDVLTIGLTAAQAAPALLSFRESCARLTTRPDNSGLTQPADWKPACDAAATWPTSDAARFFTENFETAIVGDGQAVVTGYYEPEIAGSRFHQPGFDVPVYGVPADLVHARPGDAPVKPNGQTPFGRYDEAGHFVPYYERAEIAAGKLAGQNLEIAWAADPVEFFFLQVQGSGRLRAPDGSVMHIGYAADNGQNYTGIGVVMRDRGLIGTGPGQYAASMQGLMQYLREHPAEGRDLMNTNKSWPSACRFARMSVSPPIRCSCRSEHRCSSTSTAPSPADCGWRRTPAAQSRALTASIHSGAPAPTPGSPPAG